MWCKALSFCTKIIDKKYIKYQNSRMSKPERSKPSAVDIRNMLSVDGESSSLPEELVYTALGMYNDSDYVSLAETVVELGGLDDVARAEARLEVIDDYDRRKDGYPGSAYDAKLREIRVAGVTAILKSLPEEQQTRFYEELEAESEHHYLEQIMIDRNLPYF